MSCNPDASTGLSPFSTHDAAALAPTLRATCVRYMDNALSRLSVGDNFAAPWAGGVGGVSERTTWTSLEWPDNSQGIGKFTVIMVWSKTLPKPSLAGENACAVRLRMGLVSSAFPVSEISANRTA